MPDLIIDGLKVSVPQGTNVLQAAERVGVMIPRFCWHPALGSAGSCRMCAVMFTDGPVKGLQMSCMVKARDQMVVDTGHPEALEYRRHVAELLMLHHPHDCPVCDEGGHCLLQDTVISCGHSSRQFGGRKRTYVNQDLGPLVAQEMNRCIHCYRCARYYQEFAGGRDFGPRRIAGDVSYARYRPGVLESPFAGNLTQICPTGVFTDKPSRHKARHWDLESAHGVCPHCSLGCNTEPFTRYRSVIKVEARENPEVNGHFICDRGRHGYEYANLAARPRQASVDGLEASMDEALATAAERLGRIRAAHGPGAVAALGSSRQSLESMAALKLLAGAAGWQHPEFTTGAHRKKSLLAAVKASAKDLRVSLGEIAKSDCILIVGGAPLSEAPMLALSARQAVRKGASVMVIDPRPVELPFEFTHVPARKRQIEAALGAVLHEALADAKASLVADQAAFLADLPEAMPEGVDAPGWEDFAKRLGESAFPVAVCGTDIVSVTTPGLAAAAAELLAAARGKAGFFPVLAGANAFGSALMNQKDTSFDDVLQGIEAGHIKALVCVESDPAGRHANHARMQAAIYKLDLLVCIDYLPTATRLQANIFLPSQTVFEAGGSFINNEGRTQRAAPVMAGGAPLNQTVKDGHPPRVYSKDVPGGAPLPARDILAGLAGLLGCGQALPGDPRLAVAKCLPALEGFMRAHAPHAAGTVVAQGSSAGAGAARQVQAGGSRAPDASFMALAGGEAPSSALVLPDAPEVPRLAARPSTSPPADHADIIVTEQAFGTEELSSYGSILKSLAPSPQVVINARDAGAIKLRDEDFVNWTCPMGQVSCYSRLVDNMARSTVVLPRRPDSGWRHAVADGFTVELKLLSKDAKPPEDNDNREAPS
jgi:NADH-quinone oxidoreductase subunit G